MRRSITGFVCGLIGSLFSLFWGFVCGLTGNAFDLVTTELVVFQVLGWVAFLGAILGITGASLCFKKARSGAICLSIATLMCGALQMYLFINSFNSAFLMTAIIVFLLPTILLIVSAVFAWVAKATNKPSANFQTVNTNVQQPMFQQPQTNNVQPNVHPQPQAPHAKTLEDELNSLRDMYDRNLITEDEFAEAKKNVLNKYTK